MAVCGKKCVDFCKDITKLQVYTFRIKKKQDDKNLLETITKIQNVFKIWRTRSLTLEGKIKVFKTLTISKIVYLSMIIKVPTEIIIELEKIQKRFTWPTKPKIKSETISSDFKDGGIKNVGIIKKTASLQCSWILIPLKLIKNLLGDNLKFHSNLSFNNSYFRNFPCFNKNISLNWEQYLSTDAETISDIFSKNLCFNKHLIIDDSIVNFTKF